MKCKARIKRCLAQAPLVNEEFLMTVKILNTSENPETVWYSYTIILLIHLMLYRGLILQSRKMEVESIVDARLQERCPKQVAKVLAISARHCVQHETDHRPDMAVIVESLAPLVEQLFDKKL